MSKPITAGMVNELRQRTGLPMMECKAALVHVGGDMDKAIDHIRVTVKGAGIKRAGNETAEGRVAVAVSGDIGAIVELRCESAPVAKNELFVAYANQVAQAVAKHNPASVEALMATEIAPGKTAADGLTDLIGVLRENMKIHRFNRLTGGVFGSYVHHDGTLRVLIQGSGTGDPEVLRNLSMHVAAVSRRRSRPSGRTSRPRSSRRRSRSPRRRPRRRASRPDRPEDRRRAAEDVVRGKRARRAAVRDGPGHDGRRPVEGPSWT